MKKIVLLSFTFVSLFANAQKVNVEIGKTFKVTTSLESTTEMMGSEGTTKTSLNSTTKITALEKDLYKGTNTLTKMTVSGNMMGQDIKFDSDKKEDMNGQLGQMMGGSVNKSIDFTLDKNTGAYTLIKGEKEEGMGSMMGGGDNSNSTVFYISVIGKKVGDKWIENSDADGIKTVKNYEVLTINGNVITLSLNSTKKGTSTTEMNGQSSEVTIDEKGKGTLTIDALTGILKQSAMDVENSTSMEMGGQSMVIGNKSKITVVVE